MSDRSELSQEAVSQAEILRLNKVVKALIARAERESAAGSHYSLFETNARLESQVRERTQALEAALRENEKINRDLQTAKEKLEQDKEEQRRLIQKLEETHDQLQQSEKLASIGQLAAGVAHEINNPIGFVSSNLGVLQRYVGSVFELLDGYDALLPKLASCPGVVAEIEALKQQTDVDYVRSDLASLISESMDGTERVRRIVQDLRDFSRSADAGLAPFNLQEGLESTLNVVANQIRYKAEVVRCYGDLPPVECRGAQINQVFLNLLVNATQAIQDRGRITLTTRREGDWAVASISDTGCGIAPEIRDRIFDPFFTTKPVGQGTGLGLSVSYGIVQKHGGRIEVESELGVGTTFSIWLPIRAVQEAPVAQLQ